MCHTIRDEDDLHFKVFYSVSETNAGSSPVVFSSDDQTPFAYNNGTGWAVFPAGGYFCNQHQHIGEITYHQRILLKPQPTVFWEIIANDGTFDGFPSVIRRFDIGGRTWTDATLTGLITRIRNDHIYELRQEINYARVSRTLSSNTWTDATLTPDQTPIRDDHIMELRTATGRHRHESLQRNLRY